MAYNLVFNTAIPDDLTNALQYYDGISEQLGDRFRQEVERRLDDLATRPESFGFDIPPIRFTRVGRFPYLIFFVVKKNDVLIIAILHGSSDPGKWRERL